MDNRIFSFFNQEMNEEERIRFLDAIEKNEILKQDFIDYKKVHSLFAFNEKQNENIEAKDNYQKFSKTMKSRAMKKLLRNISKYAAAILIIIGGTYFFTRQRYEQIIAKQVNIFETLPGQTVKLSLADGTDVWLNGNSKIIYPAIFLTKERVVQVEGEAFFDVAKKKDSYFLVESKDFKMKVLGTQFTIKNYSQDKLASVSLLEGLVEVTVDNKTIQLHPNQQLLYTEDNISTLGMTNKDEFTWVRGIYSFTDMTLKEIVQRLQIYYDIDIVIADKELDELRYTGKFRQKDGIITILEILKKTHSFTIKKDIESNRITLE